VHAVGSVTSDFPVLLFLHKTLNTYNPINYNKNWYSTAPTMAGSLPEMQ